MPGHEPSVSSLADTLARRDPAAASVRSRIAIARPGDAVRALIAAVLVLSLVFLAALLAFGLRVSEMVGEVRGLQRERDRQERLAPPSAAVAADADATRRELLARPLAARVIWQARCEHLAAAGDWAGLDAACTQAALDDPEALNEASLLLHAEAQVRLGRAADAARTLTRIDQTRLDDAGRARAADLAGRIWLVQRPAEQVGQPPSEGRDQLDAR